jgi:hypothetical protein
MQHGTALSLLTNVTRNGSRADLNVRYGMRATMPSPHVQYDPSREYLNAVARTEELDRLREQARVRKSILIFGPEGVGKSRLLRTFCASEQFALFVGNSRSPREFLLELLEAMRTTTKSDTIPKDISALSARSLKGIAHRALDLAPYFIAIDHLSGPSRVLTGIVKDLHYYGRTPIFFAARSPHMEDIGALQALCALKTERIELRNWTQPIALEFAKRQTVTIGLWATNLESALHSFVEWSEGNPSIILGLLEMASRPRYRMDDQIKAHILYVDYRMGRRT